MTDFGRWGLLQMGDTILIKRPERLVRGVVESMNEVVGWTSRPWTRTVTGYWYVEEAEYLRVGFDTNNVRLALQDDIVAVTKKEVEL